MPQYDAVTFRPRPVNRPILSLDDFLPPLRAVKVTISPEEAKTLFSSPIILIPAEPDFVHQLLFVEVLREPGNAFTVGSAGSLAVQSGTTTAVTLMTATNFYGGTITVPRKAAFVTQGTPSTVGFGVATATFIDQINLSINLTLTTADMATAGTGNTIVLVLYRNYPANPIQGLA